jgi:hypothetical protein
MCIPIIVAFIFAGYVLMYLFKKYRNIKSTNRLSVLLLPLLPFIIFAPLERSLLVEKKQISEVSTERIFAYSPVQVFDAIKSVDTLDAIKPYLMKFDLPIPIKCILEKEEVGGIRICYFKSGRFSNGEFGSGTITERITEIKRGEVLKMDVIGYNLVGRKWIGFKEAVYYFNAMPDGKCKLTRITTYTSELRPRFYWAPLEKLGIVQEHDYVFSNLQKDLMQRYGR